MKETVEEVGHETTPLKYTIPILFPCLSSMEAICDPVTLRSFHFHYHFCGNRSPLSEPMCALLTGASEGRKDRLS